MRFFTPDLLEQFGSDDDQTALAAQEELERRSDAYSRRLAEMEGKLPQRFQELLDQCYLHDARVLAHSDPSHAHLVSRAPSEQSAERPGSLSVNRDVGDLPSFWIVVALDTPPRDLVILQYRSAIVEEHVFHESLRDDEVPFREWQHDEADIVQDGECTIFRHSILFSGGMELRLRFRDFDFARLKSIDLNQEVERAGFQKLE